MQITNIKKLTVHFSPEGIQPNLIFIKRLKVRKVN